MLAFDRGERAALLWTAKPLMSLPCSRRRVVTALVACLFCMMPAPASAPSSGHPARG